MCAYCPFIYPSFRDNRGVWKKTSDVFNISPISTSALVTSIWRSFRDRRGQGPKGVATYFLFGDKSWAVWPTYLQNQKRHRIWVTLFSNLGADPPNLFTAEDVSPVPPFPTPLAGGGFPPPVGFKLAQTPSVRGLSKQVEYAAVPISSNGTYHYGNWSMVISCADPCHLI